MFQIGTMALSKFIPVVDRPNECNNPLCTHCYGYGPNWECTGQCDDPIEQDNRTLRDLVEQCKPSIAFMCEFKKSIKQIFYGRYFGRLSMMCELPWEYAKEEFVRSYPTLKKNKYFTGNHHEFAWCICAMAKYYFKNR